MRILKPGDPCPCCGTPLRDSLPKRDMLLLSFIAEGISLLDMVSALAEVMELPTLGGITVEPEGEVPGFSSPEPVRGPDTLAPTSSEAEEKRAILRRLKDYRAAHGPGCLAAVSARTARRKDRRISDDVLRHICADGAPKMPIADWRCIGKALDKLEGGNG